mmetsp:Transcript_70950/g.125439  ORF Transcript_70950/g.125439 Transcript_70950/m.125439 type:complete len:601 (+) Transcript_70950:44-1846(+)
MQLLTPPSAHREVMQQQASEHRGVAEKRRDDAFSMKVAQERVRAAETKREQIILAQRERDAYLANVRSLFQIDAESVGQDEGSSSGNRKSSAVHRRALPLARPPLLRGDGGSSSSCCTSARANTPASARKALAKPGQPAWSEVSTAAPSTAGGDDDFADGPSSYCGLSPAGQASELLQSLDLQVGDRLRTSLKEWLEAQDDKPSVDDSPSSRHAGQEEHEALFSFADSLEDLGAALRKEAASSPSGEKLCRRLTDSSSEDEVAPKLLERPHGQQVSTAGALTPSAVPLARVVPSRIPAPRISRCADVTKDPQLAKAEQRAPASVPVPSRIPEPKISSRAHQDPQSVKAPQRAAASVPVVVSAPQSQLFKAPSRIPVNSAKPEAAQPSEGKQCDVANAEQHRTKPSSAPVATGTSENPPRRNKPAAAAPIIKCPPPSMKALRSEEEALNQSLLRMDFEEMKRQFGGKGPLWRGAEVLSDTFKADPEREGKLQASLDRLNNALADLRARNEERMQNLSEKHRKQDVPSSESRPPHVGPDVAPGGKRTRPRSASVGRTAYAGAHRGVKSVAAVVTSTAARSGSQPSAQGRSGNDAKPLHLRAA